MNNKRSSILVTGCAGFIGGNFVRSFKKRFPKIKIIGLDNLSFGRRDALSPGITFYEGSITDEKLTEKIFKKHRPKYIFHFAAIASVPYSVEYPFETTEVNIAGTARLLELAVRYNAKRFIYSSSCAVYGPVRVLPISEKTPINPISPYGFQKYAGEPLCQITSQLHGLETICLRYFNVFGPGQYGGSAYSSVVSGWLEALYFPEGPLRMEGDGTQSRDFCYVDNVVEANIKAMRAKRTFQGEVMNIGSGQRIQLLRLKKLIEQHIGHSLNFEKTPARVGDIKHTLADIRLARRLIDYEPQISFAEGLKRTLKWFEERSRLNNS